MKKTLSLLAVSMLAVSASAADAAELHVMGEIAQSSCSIASSDIVVDMPKFHTNEFSGVGPQAKGATKFDIQLTGCPRTYSSKNSSGKIDLFDNVYVQFDNTKITTGLAHNDKIISQNGNLANRVFKHNTGPSNLEVQLATVVDGKSTPIDLLNNPNGEGIKLDQPGANGSIAIPMMASYYVADDKPVIAGRFMSTIGFKIDYK